MKRFLLLMAVLAMGGGSGCGGGGGNTTGCTPYADTCSGETICVSGACEAAFPRAYQINDIEVSVPTTDSTGAAWDALGGAPDLYITLNGAASTTRNDTFSAAFPGPYDVSLIAGGGVTIEVWDEDVTVDDLMYTCGGNSLTAALLRGRILSCSSGGFTVSFQIDPR